MRYPFQQVVETESGLREVLGTPSGMSVTKQIDTLDRFCVQFIERAPFAVVGTANRDGRCDVSPRGDCPGFVKVLDDRTLLIPERPGNRRGDTLTNILENPHAGVIFIIPTVEDSLRVNGQAAIVRDPELLEKLAARGKQPELAIAIEAEEVFFHCAKAFKRSELWNPAGWADQSDLPTLGEILLEQTRTADSLETIERSIADSYANRLY